MKEKKLNYNYMSMEGSKSKKIENKKQEKGFFIELIKTVLLALLIVTPIKMFIIQPFFVHGASMQPNFHDGDYLIVKEFGYKTTAIAAGDKNILTVKPFKKVKRGNVVVFRNPNNQSQFFIKRIIGLPGEKVVIANGKIKIYNDENKSGFILEEKTYLPANIFTGRSRNFNLNKGEYVVLGDNRNNSSDSRYWGVLDENLIIGKVLLRAWPVRDFKVY